MTLTIHQANYLLDQQRRRLEKDFVKKGGIREQMTKTRLDYRKKQQSRPPQPPTPPSAPPPSPPTNTTRKPMSCP